jgi:hypothetical protein
MEIVKAFELYRNLLSDEARQPWDKIVQAQTTKCPWEDIHGVTHDETPTNTWDSFIECVTFHLQQVFRHDMGKALKSKILYHEYVEEAQPDSDSSVFGTRRAAQQLP